MNFDHRGRRSHWWSWATGYTRTLHFSNRTMRLRISPGPGKQLASGCRKSPRSTEYYLAFIRTLDDPVTVAVDLIPIDASRRVRKTRCLAVCARGSALIAHPRRKSGIQRALEPVGARAPVGLPVGEWVSRCFSDRRTWRRIRAEREGTPVHSGRHSPLSPAAKMAAKPENALTAHDGGGGPSQPPSFVRSLILC